MNLQAGLQVLWAMCKPLASRGGCHVPSCAVRTLSKKPGIRVYRDGEAGSFVTLPGKVEKATPLLRALQYGSANDTIRLWCVYSELLLDATIAWANASWTRTEEAN